MEAQSFFGGRARLLLHTMQVRAQQRDEVCDQVLVKFPDAAMEPSGWAGSYVLLSHARSWPTARLRRPLAFGLR